MQVINDRDNRRHLESLAELIHAIYHDYPQFADLRVKTCLMMFAKSNPFLKHGNYRAFLAYDGGIPVSHACAIVDQRLPGIGLIGFFETVDNNIAAQSVLAESVRYLFRCGIRTIRAPVDCTTWNGFRLSCSDEPAPFFSEPFNRSYYPDCFHNFGFKVAQRNVSTIHSVESIGFDRFQPHFERLQEAGFTFERMPEPRLSEVLPKLHKLVIACFADTWSFVPVTLEEFQYSFADLVPSISEIIVYVAYTLEGEPVGFCFGALDWPWNGRRVIIKSIGVVPMGRRLEIARALVYCVYVEARERGASEFILSTMRDDNKQLRALTWGSRKSYRQYEVYELNVERGSP